MRCAWIVTLGRMQIRMHPLLLAVLIGACILGKLNELLQAVFALLLHEVSHIAAAKAFGVPIRTVEVYPFGGIARMDESHILPDTEWGIAAAGPAMSFIAAGISALLCYLSPVTGARIESFLTYNLTLATVNLLPALPLDGGRIARYLIGRKLGASFSQRMTAWIGMVAGVVMLLIAVVAMHKELYHLTLPVMGVFLLLSSASEWKKAPDKQLVALWQKEDALRQHGMEVHLVAACASMTGNDALRLMRTNRYTYLRVLDEQMRIMGELDEAALLMGMVRLGSDARIGDILQEKKQ